MIQHHKLTQIIQVVSSKVQKMYKMIYHYEYTLLLLCYEYTYIYTYHPIPWIQEVEQL